VAALKYSSQASCPCPPANTTDPRVPSLDVAGLFPTQDSLGIPRSRQYPRGYFSAAIGKPARNVFSRKVLRLDGLSIVLRLHRPYHITMR
jgi:hypothetical protein